MSANSIFAKQTETNIDYEAYKFPAEIRICIKPLPYGIDEKSLEAVLIPYSEKVEDVYVSNKLFNSFPSLVMAHPEKIYSIGFATITVLSGGQLRSILNLQYASLSVLTEDGPISSNYSIKIEIAKKEQYSELLKYERTPERNAKIEAAIARKQRRLQKPIIEVNKLISKYDRINMHRTRFREFELKMLAEADKTNPEIKYNPDELRQELIQHTGDIHYEKVDEREFAKISALIITKNIKQKNQEKLAYALKIRKQLKEKQDSEAEKINAEQNKKEISNNEIFNTNNDKEIIIKQAKEKTKEELEIEAKTREDSRKLLLSLSLNKGKKKRLIPLLHSQ